MSLPLIAARTYEALKEDGDVRKIVKNFTKKLIRQRNPIKRARFVHSKIGSSLERLFEDPIVKKHVSCHKGCSACCHTQVSVTEDEAFLLSQYIEKGLEINWDNFKKQVQAKNDGALFFKIPYDERKCVFLGDDGACRVYDDRPSVCRTNYVVSDPLDCETKNGVSSKIRLLKTVAADLLIYAYFKFSRDNGVMAHMIYKQLSKQNRRDRERFL